jgi:uncharacterized protein YgiM (DUF1202 family)
VVAEIYNAERVTVLEKDPEGWWRVQSSRDEKIGWTQQELLSFAPISAKTYYIAVDGLVLRNAPAEDAVSRLLLGYGDKVQRIADKHGWWFVVVEKDKAIGWIPASMASEEPPGPGRMKSARAAEPAQAGEAPSQVPPGSESRPYFVAAENFKLHSIPADGSHVVKVLKLNDKVVKIARSGADWVKVKFLETGAEGWARTRFLKESPVTGSAQIVKEQKKSRKKPRPSNQKIQDALKAKPLEPEGM